jgi:hypothetical protein
LTIRNPVSAPQNLWYDAQEVDNTDLTLEQQFNNTIDTATIANHIGYGVIPDALVENVIFNSILSTGFLDGLAIQAQNQPTDTNFGNQLAITLTNSKVGGSKTIKVGIIGLDFQSNLQYETFIFRANETQVGAQHFTQVLVLLFNDFIGNPNLSFNLGGQIVIQEATPMTLSRDTLSVAQNVQPNLFFRDFFVTGTANIQTLLQAALPLYNISTLNIQTTQLGQQVLLNGDVTTQIGEKLVLVTNNIQKVTFLLAVQNTVVGQSNNLVWNGDLVCSIYPLQSTVSCSSDLVPNVAIDYSPSPTPLAQISYDYPSLQQTGVVLNEVPQPVDFVFSNSPIAAGNVLVPGNYYAITLTRNGAANQCDILISTGAATVPNSRITVFSSSLWVDIPDQQLWFEVWTDAAKVSDGQAYDNGNGVIIPKTIIDPTTNATIDYSFNDLQFVGNEVYSAVLSAITVDSDPVPDPRTGEPVDSIQQYEPQVQLLNPIDITNLEAASEPLILGAITDKNIKFYNSANSAINSLLFSATMAGDELLIRIVDDPTDPVRFQSSVTLLQSYLLDGDFINATIIPDNTNPNVFYRIATARLCTYIVGDVDGNGIVDVNDLNLLNSYLGYNMNVGLPLNTILTTDGYTHTNVINGYTTYINPFVSQFGISFQLIDGYGNIIADGYDGVLVANPNDNRLGQFTSASVMFNTIIGLSNYQLVMLTPSTLPDYGAFNIISLDSVANVITIQKVYLTGDVLGQMLRADIDGDFVITQNDGYLLDSYIERLSLPTVPPYPSPYPGPTSNPYAKIGTTFNVLRFRLQEAVDRTDDYTPTPATRATSLHPNPDIFEGDGYFAYPHNYYVNPVPIQFQEELSWDESLVVTNSNPKTVPSVFTYETGFTQNSCVIDGIVCNIYGSPPAFDKGRVDYYVPDNLIIGDGQIITPDGDYYKVDFEVGTIVLEIPDGLFGSERTLDLLGDFIVDATGTGITALGFPAMRFADCSTVQSTALQNDQLRFSVAVQSFSPNTNGLSSDGYTGVIVDGKMGVNIDYATGLLTLNFTNLYQDAILQTLSTKVQISVFLKKGGFNNQPLFVNSTQVQNLLQLISVFSGANVGGAGALEPAADVSYMPATPTNWAGTPPATVQQALDRIAAALVAAGHTP